MLGYSLLLKTQLVDPHLGRGRVTKTPKTVQLWASHLSTLWVSVSPEREMRRAYFWESPEMFAAGAPFLQGVLWGPRTCWRASLKERGHWSAEKARREAQVHGNRTELLRIFHNRE